MPDCQAVLTALPLRPFDDTVLDFFNGLSRRLIKVRGYADVATFGFWCRKAALLKEKDRYDDIGSRLGRGLVFHSTPSNVPVNFAYSFAAGLLAGNANIVRLPGRDFEQTRIIVDTVADLLANRHQELSAYLFFVQYPPDKELNDRYSAVCDARVVWGGDNTVRELRQSPLKPRAVELTFANRYSIAVIRAGHYLQSADKRKIARDFYNDTYLSDQNACTSPHIIFWLGGGADGSIESAKTIFWGHMREIVSENYTLAPVQAVGKLAAFYKAAARVPGIYLVGGGDSYVTRAQTARADERLPDHTYNSGFFYECDIQALDEILPVCGERMQTLVYYGLSGEEIRAFMTKHRPKGIDRAVPVGKSMDFTLVWDGYDLIRQLSRKVSVIG